MDAHEDTEPNAISDESQTEGASSSPRDDDPDRSTLEGETAQTTQTEHKAPDAGDAADDNADGMGAGDARDLESTESASAAASGGPYDFRKPARLPVLVQRRLDRWQQRIKTLVPVKLGTHVPNVTCAVAPQEVGNPDDVSSPQPMIAFRVAVNGVETILGIHRPMAVTLVAAMLGEEIETLRDDRALTLVEQSLFDLIVRDLVELLDETGEPISVRSELLGGERRTQLIRLFPPGKPLVTLNFLLEAEFGAGQISWIWPQSLAEQLFDGEEIAVAAPQLPDLAQRLPFELSVRLGKAKISVQQLAKLQPGDVVVLDQTVRDPLVAEVGGAEKMHVWPGRDGTRQAIRIEEIVVD